MYSALDNTFFRFASFSAEFWLACAKVENVPSKFVENFAIKFVIGVSYDPYGAVLITFRFLVAGAVLTGVAAISGCAGKDLEANSGAVVVEVEDADAFIREVGASIPDSTRTRTRKVILSAEEQAELASRGNTPNIVLRTKARANYCPKLEILSGTGVLTAYTADGNDTAQDITHQATITKSGRECARNEGVLTMRVGAAGRAIKGPKSASNDVSLPIRIAVIKGGSEVLFSQLYKQSLVFSSRTAQGFSFVEENVSIPIPEEENIQVIVGFDTQQDGADADAQGDAG